MQIGGVGSGTANHKYFSLSVQGVATKGCNGLQWLVQMQVVVQSKTKSKEENGIIIKSFFKNDEFRLQRFENE